MTTNKSAKIQYLTMMSVFKANVYIMY